MSAVLVRQALEVALAAMSPALATAYENAPFTPTAAAYQQVYLLLAEPDNPEMGSARYTERGYFQINLKYPLNAGSAAAATRAELIRSTFYRARSFSNGSVTVHIEKTPEIAPARVEDDRFVVPVKIRFFAHVLRS
jgi:hypothetical protein